MDNPEEEYGVTEQQLEAALIVGVCVIVGTLMLGLAIIPRLLELVGLI